MRTSDVIDYFNRYRTLVGMSTMIQPEYLNKHCKVEPERYSFLYHGKINFSGAFSDKANREELDRILYNLRNENYIADLVCTKVGKFVIGLEQPITIDDLSYQPVIHYDAHTLYASGLQFWNREYSICVIDKSRNLIGVVYYEDQRYNVNIYSRSNQKGINCSSTLTIADFIAKHMQSFRWVDEQFADMYMSDVRPCSDFDSLA